MEPMVWTTLGTTCRRCHKWVGIPGRPPYVLPCGSAGWKRKKVYTLWHSGLYGTYLETNQFLYGHRSQAMLWYKPFQPGIGKFKRFYANISRVWCPEIQIFHNFIEKTSLGHDSFIQSWATSLEAKSKVNKSELKKMTSSRISYKMHDSEIQNDVCRSCIIMSLGRVLLFSSLPNSTFSACHPKHWRLQKSLPPKPILCGVCLRREWRWTSRQWMPTQIFFYAVDSSFWLPHWTDSLPAGRIEQSECWGRLKIALLRDWR